MKCAQICHIYEICFTKRSLQTLGGDAEESLSACVYSMFYTPRASQNGKYTPLSLLLSPAHCVPFLSMSCR